MSAATQDPIAPVHSDSDAHLVRDGCTLDTGRREHEAQPDLAGAVPPPGPGTVTLPNERAARADALLLLYADALDDLERVRIATENRVRSLVQVKGMEGSAEQARLEGLTDALRVLEHDAELELKRAMRPHPLGPWVKRTIGIGEKQGARLLAAIGDPAERRTVSQLWAYCGYHVLHPGPTRSDTQCAPAGVDPSSDLHRPPPVDQSMCVGVAPRRQRGQKANWNSTAKMRAFLCAESCIKQARSPYRPIYDDRRAHTATTHPEWTAGHSHNDALRIVAKAILRDLWVEARSVAA